MRGLTKVQFEQIIAEHGYSIKETHQSIYYRSLARWCDETFWHVMDGERQHCYFNTWTIEKWTTEPQLRQILDEKGDE